MVLVTWRTDDIRRGTILSCLEQAVPYEGDRLSPLRFPRRSQM